MPIRAENRDRYPPEWPLISLWVRVCAGWRCEWCNAEHGEPHPITGSKVVLTVAHLDHQPENCAPTNLVGLCQRCHNGHDAKARRAGIRTRERQAMGTGELLDAVGREMPGAAT